MKALTWHGKSDIRCESVPDPQILDPRDVIIKVTSCAICGSDLHLYDGYNPFMETGDIVGHEFMGEVVETGAGHSKFKVGDRIVVPFTIACGECFFCQKGWFSGCERTNPNFELAKGLWGHSPAGLFGYSHLVGPYAGGQAEFVRVPYADVCPIKVPEGVPDEQVLFLGDILPTGFMAADFCDIGPEDTIAVWGCGPVGQFAIRSAFLLGARRVIAIDKVPERLALARKAGAETIDFSAEDVTERINDLTSGRGADACIDAVGAEASAHGGLDAVLDKVKAAAYLATDRAHALREAIMNCRNGGIVSIVGVYAGFLDNVPFGSAMNRGLTFRMAQTPVPRYHEMLLNRVLNGDIDPTEIITHTLPLDDGPEAYRTFRDKQDGCVKVVLKP